MKNRKDSDTAKHSSQTTHSGQKSDSGELRVQDLGRHHHSSRIITASVMLFVMILLACGVYFSFFDYSNETKASNVSPLFHSEERKVYDPVLPDKAVKLPADFQLHPDFQHEWWHYFASVVDAEGQEYGIQWSYFRVATDERETSGWQSPQLYIANVVISSGTKTWKEQRLARGGIGQAGMRNRPFRIWLDNWSWRSLSSTPFPGLLDVQSDEFGMVLTSKTIGPYVLNGDKGYQIKHDLLPIASYSFSAPFLSVQGQLRLEGQPAFAVKGKAWLNKEWGSALLAEGRRGWDWFVFDLDDGRTLSVTQSRYDQQLPYTYGTLADRSGKVISLSDSDISITPLNTSTLPNGRRLPLQWSIEVPESNIKLMTKVVRRDMWLPFVIPYWEGPVSASGSHEAKGFMQLTGY